MNLKAKFSKCSVFKKFLCLTLAVVILIGACPISTFAANNATTTAGVNFRSGPGTNYNKIGVVYEGQRIEVLEKSGDWYKVNVNGTVGYITAEWVNLDSGASIGSSSSSSSGNNSGSAASGEKYKTTTDVNFRSGPSSNTTKIGTVAEGTIVTLVEKYNSTWYKIKTPEGTIGYLCTDYLVKYTESSSSGSNSGSSSSGSNNNSGSTETATSEKYKTTTDVNFRSGPSSSTTKIGTVAEGTVVTLISKVSAEWFKVRTPDGTEGYLCNLYLVKYTENSSSGSNSGSSGSGSNSGSSSSGSETLNEKYINYL